MRLDKSLASNIQFNGQRPCGSLGTGAEEEWFIFAW